MSSTIDLPPRGRHPERIGDFRILRTLGEGGMGVVYEAEQDNPRRRVALKVVRAAHMTPEMLKRFDREAHVLGLLQHPGIAQIYQAGTADAGHGEEPYFAMELVQGRSLTIYARDEGLSLRQKLELLARVCDAVQHAHQKGVVHRDLKPGNILVVGEGGSSSFSTTSAPTTSAARLDDVAKVGQPKILDFGLARLTESDLPALTLQTEVGQILGTVQYMSPEQVTGDSANIDSRSDVYALGVIGYELVSGGHPHELRGKAVHEALRTIREDEATMLSSVDRTLRGDVETIVAKALEKDPAQRYPTAADMAADIRRFLRDEPILARPPSTVYQLRKFAARNRILVGGIAAVFLALVAGLIGTWMGFLEARRNEIIARDRSEEARLRAEEAVRSRDEANLARDEATRSRDEATAARAAADASAAEAQAINDFLVKDMLSAVNPNVAKGRTITLDEVLENARAHADEAFEGQPLLSARLHKTLGEIEYRLGRFVEAERHFRLAWTSSREHLGNSDALTREAQQDLGRCLSALGRHSEACELQEEVVDLTRQENDDARLQSALTALGQAYRLQGDADASQAAYDEALEILEARPPGPGDGPGPLPALLSDRASLYRHRGLYDEAQRDYERALEIYRGEFGDVHPDVARVLGMLAHTMKDRGQLDEARTQMEAVLEMQRKLFAKDHPDLARSLSSLGSIAFSQGNYREAETRVREAITMRSGLQGFDEIDLAQDRVRLSDILCALGRFGEAEAEAAEGLARLEQDLGTRDSEIAAALFTLALARRGQGNYEGAAEAAARSLSIRRGLEDGDPRNLAQSTSLLAQILQSRKEYAEAERLYREAREMYERLEGPGSLNVAIADVNLGQFLLDRGEVEAAETNMRAGVEKAAALLPDDHPTLAGMRSNLARSLRRAQKNTEAIELLRRVLDSQRKRLPAAHGSTLITLVQLGEILTETGSAGDAEPLLREAVEGWRTRTPPNAARSASAGTALGACLLAQNRPEEAESLLLESHAAWAALGNEPEETSRAARRLADLYETLGRPTDAETWRAKALETR